MKTNKLFFALILGLSLIAFSSTKSLAQGRFSVGPAVGLPMGSWGDFVGFGIGGSVGYESAINDQLNWTASVSYISFSGKDFSGTTGPSASMVPILGGVKYYFGGSAFEGFYANGQAGFTITSIPLGSFGTVSSTNFTIAPGVGYHLANIDIGASYQIVSDANYLGIRVAYVLGGK